MCIQPRRYMDSVNVNTKGVTKLDNKRQPHAAAVMTRAQVVLHIDWSKIFPVFVRRDI